ncbi:MULTISPECIES: energy transducer TonB [Niastella]|uniref:Energy transducer TonB n=1 Tax=Niastella soli TaxID=2821487 RepID=A0ABS3Z5F2_9BACT|nr:energy transducer TonB [Niastella soli]MBO9204895.1 energy transducer TonB [Niastella soli]
MKLTVGPLLILLFIAIKSFSQQTEEIVETGEKYNNERKVYSVLKENRTVKQGLYQHYLNGNVVLSGYYIMDKKDSTWQRHTSRGLLMSWKSYAENKRTGIWTFFDYDGKITLQYDFSKNEFIIRQPDSTFSYSYQSADGEWIEGKADQDPIWLRSIKEWQSFLNMTMRYPQKAIDHNKMGIVLVTVTLDEEGNAINYQVEKSVYPALDQESIRVITLFQPEFLPAVKDGKKVKAKVKIPMYFRLERG